MNEKRLRSAQELEADIHYWKKAVVDANRKLAKMEMLEARNKRMVEALMEICDLTFPSDKVGLIAAAALEGGKQDE